MNDIAIFETNSQKVGGSSAGRDCLVERATIEVFSVVRQQSFRSIHPPQKTTASTPPSPLTTQK